MGSSKKSKKRKRSSPVEEETFAVELILKARVVEGALDKTQDEHWEYYVKWAGYDSDANTWEPARNFAQCERLVASFWEDVGWDNVDYPEGTEVIPSDTWINTEKKLFWQGLTPKERLKYQRKEAEQRTQTQQRKAVDNAYVMEMESSPEPPKHKKKKLCINEEESDGSDVPLIKQDTSKLKTLNAKYHEGLNNVERNKREAKARKFERLTELSAERSDKGKQKLVEEIHPDSPSSLFSADSDESDEVLILPTQPKSLPQERKAPKGLMSVANKSGSSRFSSTVLSETPPPKSTSLPSIPILLTGLSTKQRIAAGASNLYNPKDMKTMTTAPQRTNPNQASSSNLSNSKFKKDSGLTVAIPYESTVGSSMTRPPQLTSNALDTQVQLPVNRLFQTDPPVPPSNLSSTSLRAPQSLDVHEADKFLASMASLLPGFAGPVKSPPEAAFEPKPPPGLVPSRKASDLPKIQKRWKWESQLFIIKEDGEEELVGSVICSNVTTPKIRGMRIPLTFDAMRRLDFISFHQLSDALIFLEACKTPDQFATLAGQDIESQLQVKIIATYMAKYEQVTLVPVWYENNVVGHLMIFPPTLNDLIHQLEVPEETVKQAAEGLIVSLHGWIVNPMMQQQEWRLPLSDLIPANTSLPPIFAKARTQAGLSGSVVDHNSVLRANIQFALRTVTFPPDLFDWLTSSFRSYAIYHEYDRKSEPIELRMLKAILQTCHAQEWKHQGSNYRKEYRLRVVFIHVGSLHSFYRSSLTQKRDSLDIRFYSYGTDIHTPRGMWGLREIYPIGGIVTFYPSAFMDDYIGAIRLIQKINEHPLWMAFISPACLGYLVNITCPESQDPLAICEQQGREYVYHRLLRLIEDGEIALISIPYYPTSNERVKMWIRNHGRILNPLSALSIGNTAFNSVCANVPQIDWVAMVQKNVDDDIVAAQRHPAILYEHRRFIVVKGAKDLAVTPTSVETATPSQFDFQDDYFK